MKIPYETMRILLAILLLIHGVAHLPGFLAPGAWLWLVGAVGFFASAVLVFRGSAAWPTLTLPMSALPLPTMIA